MGALVTQNAQSLSRFIGMYMNPGLSSFHVEPEEVGHGPKRLMEVKIDQSETRKLR